MLVLVLLINTKVVIEWHSSGGISDLPIIQKDKIDEHEKIFSNDYLFIWRKLIENFGILVVERW